MKRRILVALMIAAVLLGGFGVAACQRVRPAEQTPSPPAENTTQPEVPESPAPTEDAAVGYYLSGEHLQPARLPGVAVDDLEATARALVAGVPKDAAGFGLTSSIPPNTRVNSVVVSGEEVTVDLSSEFGSGGGSLSMQSRVAQIVFTLTRDARYKAVRIIIDGEPVESLGGEGVMIQAAQTRATWEPFSPAVLVETPVTGDTVGNPVTVAGTANVFEARFQLELTDGDGVIIARRAVSASSGTGTRGTFSADLDYSSAKPGVGSIVTSYLSPKDGSRVVVSEIPVRFP